MLDLALIKDANEAEIEIKHPITGEPTGATITLAGPEHPKRKKLVFDRQRRMRKQFQKAGKLQFTDPAEEEQEGIEFLAECTLGWKNIGENGKPIECTPANAARKYAELGWLRAQIQAGMDERENFIESSATA